MIEKKISKFESKERIEELNPKDTLINAGFKDKMVLCDIGAGTGVFSFPASKISTGDIYAIDISDGMIELLRNRVKEHNAKNIVVKKVEKDLLPVESNICDMAIMVTVLHEVDNKDSMISEIKRILKGYGKFMVIEFHERKTPMGPPVEHRISESCVEKLFNDNGFKTISKFLLGENFYSIVFEIEK
ncbi:class I SAM-dependent methyltransferase [Clostridium cylindrosporum]|uniref:Methyltransferase type 11 n=1 Tax=Clostridium cylindrosporum DSM 605 TaxID=1121307 RepID=A0A0J8FZM5_CLOCY|nr:class I SAM-dependent methyltransferase [Clostridium cylindrosporum]KMT21011.1 methyltransferase type 11 [Clostridium cylindrosporum DSM 605]